ncbi:MAG TPA: VanZ family protein [Pseudomonadales bacterium]|nr:VanZ family protein [Pseudomonadales bacterium]
MSLLAKWNNIDARWWIAAFWLAWCISTILMLLPAQDLPAVDIWDKAEHTGTFFTLMLLAALGYYEKHSLQRLALLLIAYGIAIECIQFFIPSRSFSVLDMVADSIGVLPAWWLITKIKLL